MLGTRILPEAGEGLFPVVRKGGGILGYQSPGDEDGGRRRESGNKPARWFVDHPLRKASFKYHRTLPPETASTTCFR